MAASAGLQDLLGPDGAERVARAVAAAEAGTSGELCVFLARQSDSYPEAVWRGAALGAAAACLALLLPRLPQSLAMAGVLAGAGLGAAAGLFCPPLRRLLIGRERLAAMAQRRAEEVFLHRELFKTRQRTGILLFVSLFERRAAVVADSGIAAKVAPAAWRQAVDRITEAARGRGLAEGIAQAAGHCREVLLQAGFKARPKDRDELADQPMLYEEGA